MFVELIFVYSSFNKSKKSKSKEMNKAWKVLQRACQHISRDTEITMLIMVLEAIDMVL